MMLEFTVDNVMLCMCTNTKRMYVRVGWALIRKFKGVAPKCVHIHGKIHKDDRYGIH